MKKNELKFSEDGTQFQILFKTGKESDFFTSKEAGFKAITELAKEQKIDVGDFAEMRDQILAKKELSWSEVGKDSNHRSPFGSGLLTALMAMSVFSALMEVSSSDDDVKDMPQEPIKVPYFKMFEGYGRIYFPGAMTSKINSRKQAGKILQFLVDKELIKTGEDYLKVKKEMEESALPVDKKESVEA